MQQLTPTQIQSIERRKAFRAAIAARAVPDPWSAIKEAPVVPAELKKVEAPVVVEPEPEPEPEPERPQVFPKCRAEFGITVAGIYKAVCQHYGLSRIEFMSRCRNKELVNARYVGFYLARKKLKLSFPTIARTIVSGIDHTSVMHGIHKIEKLIREGHPVAEDVKILEGVIGDKNNLDV